MKKTLIFILLLLLTSPSLYAISVLELDDNNYPIGEPGLTLTYYSSANNLPESVVQRFSLTAGAVEEMHGVSFQWLNLNAQKVNQQKYSVWILTAEYPSQVVQVAEEEISRYILSKSNENLIEFSNQTTSSVVLPNSGAWKHLLPRSENGNNPIESMEGKVKLLGIEYELDSHDQLDIPTSPKETHVISLTPDLLIGVPHNSKVKDETRRYDESDYEYIKLTKENYFEMIENGMNVFNVNSEQVKLIENENVYYWGIGGEDVLYPECLYTSNYIGPAIFFDEPMVHTRDQVFRPKFKEDNSLRKTITPELFFEAFKHEYHIAKYERSPIILLKGLSNREDVDIGDMDFLQENIYSWETMPSSALYQLSEGDKSTPYAMVFEPPGRLGARRVLPELNMSFDCQIPADDPKNLIGIIKSFLRGAARLTDKEWGISIYGQVIHSEAYWYMSHAYDQGATLFFYWDSYQLAAVPYSEYLSLSKSLRKHAANFPNRDLKKLKHSAEVAIVIPPGYNLGHVKMGIGNISGLPELNMERENQYGIKYRDVMSNYYIEAERSIRLGIEYDSFWMLPNLELDGYREIIVIREDGKVEVTINEETIILDSARVPQRPEGIAPQLSVDLNIKNDNELHTISANAIVTEESSPVYYTQGADKNGIYQNSFVLWELYGPEEEDYTDFWNDRWNVFVEENDKGAATKLDFQLDKPGKYRLKVSTADLAGRSKVVWKEFIVK